jgi:hypothetical protein
MTKTLRILLTLVMAVLLAGCAAKQQPSVQAGDAVQGGMVQAVAVQPQETPDWFFHDIVEVDFVKPLIGVPRPENTLVIDSRPYQPKHVEGHIPTSVSIPDSRFAEMTGMLPEDKSALLVFYCEGPT